MTDTEKDLMAKVTDMLGCEPDVDSHDGEVGIFDPETGDLIGTGQSLSEALEDAARTVESWQSGREDLSFDRRLELSL